MRRRPHRTIGLVTCAVTAAVLGSSCGRTGGDERRTVSSSSGVGSATRSTRRSVLDGRWYVGVAASDRVAVPRADLLRLVFYDGTLTTGGACNDTVGRYVFARGRISWDGDLESTMAACVREEAERQDRWIVVLLGRPTRVTLSDGGQTLRLSRGDRWATFRLRPSSPTPPSAPRTASSS